MIGRTFSLPRNREDGSQKEGCQKRHSRNMHTSGSFSLHGTLRRNHSNSGHFNTTLEDDVFEDSISAPNSAKPLLHEQKRYFPPHQTHFNNISPYGKYRMASSYFCAQMGFHQNVSPFFRCNGLVILVQIQISLPHRRVPERHGLFQISVPSLSSWHRPPFPDAFRILRWRAIPNGYQKVSLQFLRLFSGHP